MGGLSLEALDCGPFNYRLF